MTWTELKDKIYYWDGSWRDIYVLQTNRKFWEKWSDYVNKNYRVEWLNGKSGNVENKIDFGVVEEHWDGIHDFWSTAKVFVDRIQINAHFFIDTEIENDIDPREFISLEDHEKLIKYMIDLSTLLNKEIILTPENEHGTALIWVYEENVQML